MANLGYIQVTRICDQYCRFCSNPANDELLSFEQAKLFIDDLIARGYDGIILTGGEPTLAPELPRMIAYARERGIQSRMITNGQRTASLPYLTELVEAGLGLMHVSLHSVRPDVQGQLTQNRLSHGFIMRTLENAGRLGFRVQINCVIGHYNADHLDENVRVLCERFPFIRHFVWNNTDPEMNRVAANPDVVARLVDFEASLHRAMRYLDETGRTFRVERVPLCLLDGYEHCSTETRKIVKDEERIVHFLDFKGSVRQTGWTHGKVEVCKTCRLEPICAGLYSADQWYSSKELHPVFKDPDVVRRRVLGTTHKPREARPTPQAALLELPPPLAPGERKRRLPLLR